MPHQIALIAVVVLPFAASLVVALIRRNQRNVEAWLSGVVALVAFALVAACFPIVMGGGVIRFELPWLPKLGLDFVLRMDGFAWLFAMLITGIGGLVVLYARYYMSRADPVPRFFAFLLAFMGSMLGLVLSGNLIQLAFFWELTSVFSFLLIGYWHQNPAARAGARMTLSITVAGGLCLFAGILILGHIVGSYDLDEVLASGELIRTSPLYVPALVLILLGALTKSAQFPFHFWLPSAMTAPTPVTAYLHSATLVKAGIFLLIRLWPVLAGTEYWIWIVGTTGLITFVLGAWFAIFQQDLKRLLAYSTITHLGLITLLIGLNTRLALVAAIFHIVNHATFKSSLFMATGIVEHESGTRDIRRLGGLWAMMPATATLAMIAAAAMAGVPLLNGFLSKEMFFAEAIGVHGGSVVDAALPYIATLAALFSVTYSLHFIRGTFFGRSAPDMPRTPHEPPRWMRFPVEFLVLACLVVGVVPALTVGPFLSSAVQAVLGAAAPHYSLALWHGFTLPLLMSTIALIGGIVLYLWLRGYLSSGVEDAPVFRRIHGGRIFKFVLVMVCLRGARFLKRRLETRRLQPQLRVLLCVALIAAASPFVVRGLGGGGVTASGVDPAFALLWAVGMVCAIGCAWLAKFHRLAALILTGGAGLAVCLTFAWFSAPDLALTQLLVEVVTTVLILLGLRWLPKRLEGLEGIGAGAGRTRIARARRLRDLLIALAAGGGMAGLAYAVMTRAAPGSISDFFVKHAYTEGGGTNVVNVILVDFRAFDTLGEITVLAIVALTIFALLRRFRPAYESIGPTSQQRLQNAYDAPTAAHYLAVPALIMQVLFPFIALFGVFLLIRGHNLPGGGFAGGIAVAAALIMQYMACGVRELEARWRLRPLRWIGAGLLLAALAGIGSWFFSRPFLTSYFTHVEWPVVGTVPWATAMIFDLGVFASVVGATDLILVALAHQSIRSHRAAGGKMPPPATSKDQ